MEGLSSFYQKHFEFVRQDGSSADKIILASPSGGCSLVILQASKGHRVGQSTVKIVFDVEDVAAFKETQACHGLEFGTIHHGPGYQFANARDPAKNLIQISNSYLAE